MKVEIYCEKCEHYIMDVEREIDIFEKRKCVCGNEYMIKIYLLKKGNDKK